MIILARKKPRILIPLANIETHGRHLIQYLSLFFNPELEMEGGGGCMALLLRFCFLRCRLFCINLFVRVSSICLEDLLVAFVCKVVQTDATIRNLCWPYQQLKVKTGL